MSFHRDYNSSVMVYLHRLPPPSTCRNSFVVQIAFRSILKVGSPNTRKGKKFIPNLFWKTSWEEPQWKDQYPYALRIKGYALWVAIWEPGERSRYSDSLLAERPRGWSSSPCRIKNFLFSMSSWPALGPTQPPIQWIPGALSPWVKRPVREADHSLPASDEVKKMWIYTSITPYAFMV
jgi:hypothetical protein